MELQWVLQFPLSLLKWPCNALKKRIFENSPVNVQLWKRYVDDVIAIIPKDYIDQTLTHINSIDSNIQFSCELEQHNSISFLDLQIFKNNNGTLQFGVFRKPSHTD